MNPSVMLCVCVIAIVEVVYGSYSTFNGTKKSRSNINLIEEYIALKSGSWYMRFFLLPKTIMSDLLNINCLVLFKIYQNVKRNLISVYL